MPPTNADASIHVVPGGSAIAFTSIISGSLPPSGIYSQQPSTTTMGGANRTITLNPSLFSVDFGSHGNPQRTPGSNANTNTSSTTSTSTSTQSSTQGGGGGDNVRIVMDDIVALFSNAHPVTSHSETSRTATATPSQQHSQGGTDTQTQNSGTTGTARAVPRINIGSMPLHGNHQDPSVPCESFHFGPRSRQPQVAQPEGNAASQPNLANGLAQAFSDAVASALQDTMTGRTGSGNRTDQATPGTTPQTGKLPLDNHHDHHHHYDHDHHHYRDHHHHHDHHDQHYHHDHHHHHYHPDHHYHYDHNHYHYYNHHHFHNHDHHHHNHNQYRNHHYHYTLILKSPS